MAPAPLYLLGPTASGKSALALALAERWAGRAEIVNADAFQLYSGMETLTASPHAGEKARAPHHLYSIVSAGEECDAARYAGLARAVIHRLARRGKIPIIVGGSGLYVKALTHGLSDLPSADEPTRALISERSEASQRAWLQELDPAGAATMNLANPRHVQRALEICLLTGQPASRLKSAWREPDPSGLQGLLIDWPREVLYERINRRAEAMVRGGVAAAEVSRIDASTGFSATSGKAIGVRDLRAVNAGHLSLDKAEAAVQQATRRYAKRQLTWFQREKWLTRCAVTNEDDLLRLADRPGDPYLLPR